MAIFSKLYSQKKAKSTLKPSVTRKLHWFSKEVVIWTTDFGDFWRVKISVSIYESLKYGDKGTYILLYV